MSSNLFSKWRDCYQKLPDDGEVCVESWHFYINSVLLSRRVFWFPAFDEKTWLRRVVTSVSQVRRLKLYYFLLFGDIVNNNIYLLQLGCHPVAVVILQVYKTWNWLLLNLSRDGYYMRACSGNLECWEPSQHLLIDTGKPRKTCAKVAGRRTFRILTYINVQVRACSGARGSVGHRSFSFT